MARAFCLPEQAQIVNLMNPATDAAGRTGSYVTLKNALKAFIIVTVQQGNAATILLSILQASAVAGTGAKAVTARIWHADRHFGVEHGGIHKPIHTSVQYGYDRATEAKKCTSVPVLSDFPVNASGAIGTPR